MNYNKFETALLAQCKQIGAPIPPIKPGDVAGSISREQGTIEIYHNKDGHTIAEVVSGFPSTNLNRKVAIEYTQFERKKTKDGSETVTQKTYRAGEKEPFFEGFTKFNPDGTMQSCGIIMPDGTRAPLSASLDLDISHILTNDEYWDVLFGETDPSAYFRYFDI